MPRATAPWVGRIGVLFTAALLPGWLGRPCSAQFTLAPTGSSSRPTPRQFFHMDCWYTTDGNGVVVFGDRMDKVPDWIKREDSQIRDCSFMLTYASPLTHLDGTARQPCGDKRCKECCFSPKRKCAYRLWSSDVGFYTFSTCWACPQINCASTCPQGTYAEEYKVVGSVSSESLLLLRLKEAVYAYPLARAGERPGG